MNTTLSFSKTTLYPAKLPPWKKPKTRATVSSKSMQNLNKTPPKDWKLQANAKGFGSSTRSTPQGILQESGNNNKNERGNNDGDEPLPEEVFNRIIVRVLVSVGAPLALALGSMQLIGMAKKYQIWDVPLWVTYLTLLLTFGASTLGIAYGALSASLDPNKKGSLLGFEEAKQNWTEMWKEEDEGKSQM
ncbi:hypothetical protein Tsubulata_036243 [Turnera subulata]|uniref:Uncharacterized protein n=1 Tax=Turnera subulata TaxID=218843 RepID=A0A9Q0J9Y4_9ROSI|nr:hypothetical protein Tsubulata_036243 [Turnera subulata]